MGSLRGIKREARILDLALSRPQHWYAEGYGSVEIDDVWWYWAGEPQNYFTWHSNECSRLRWAMNRYFTSQWITVNFVVSPTGGTGGILVGYDPTHGCRGVPIDFSVPIEREESLSGPQRIFSFINRNGRSPPIDIPFLLCYTRPILTERSCHAEKEKTRTSDRDRR